MPVRLARVSTTVLQAAEASPLPTCMRFRTKSGIGHALGIGGEVVHRFVWHTPAFTGGPWAFWGLSNSSQQLLDLALNQQLAYWFRPASILLGDVSKHRPSRFANVH